MAMSLDKTPRRLPNMLLVPVPFQPAPHAPAIAFAAKHAAPPEPPPCLALRRPMRRTLASRISPLACSGSRYREEVGFAAVRGGESHTGGGRFGTRIGSNQLPARMP